ncbi:MAG: hypothetical protein K1X94_12050, partial [Sandaracinaceae bacterium]|nr:hypothetical protein [Sandaracinaceae bacterium]
MNVRVVRDEEIPSVRPRSARVSTAPSRTSGAGPRNNRRLEPRQRDPGLAPSEPVAKGPRLRERLASHGARVRALGSRVV